MQKKIENQFPPGWDEARVRAVIKHYENQSEDEAVAEDEAALDEVMPMTGSSRTTYQHILLDEEGVPWIDGTNTKVVELVAQAKAHGWSAEELAYQHPHLTLGQVYSALGYYSDHRDEIDDDLARRAAIVEEIRAEVGEHPLVAKLRARIVPIESVAVTADELIAELEDGRRISLPLAWYPRLLHATPEERTNWRLIGNGRGIHWPDLDEDLSAENLIFGQPSRESQSSLARRLHSRSADSG